jgi:hypothetical protein
MAFLFGASIITSTLCLAFAVGRAVVVRPSFGLILLRALQAALILLLLLIPIPVYTHREIFGGLVHHLVAYLAIVVSLTLPKDFASRALKVIAVVASFGLLATSQLIESGWVGTDFAGG